MSKSILYKSHRFNWKLNVDPFRLYNAYQITQSVSTIFLNLPQSPIFTHSQWHTHTYSYAHTLSHFYLSECYIIIRPNIILNCLLQSIREIQVRFHLMDEQFDEFAWIFKCSRIIIRVFFVCVIECSCFGFCCIVFFCKQLKRTYETNS